MNKWVFKPELSLEAKMMKLKLAYVGLILRRKNSIMLRKVEEVRKRRLPKGSQRLQSTRAQQGC